MLSNLVYDPGDEEFVVNEHLVIDYESDFVQDYLTELKAINSTGDIARLVRKWSGLIPECLPLLNLPEDEIPLFQAFCRQQNPNQAGAWLNARVPPSTVRLVIAAEHFGVMPGVVFLQLLEAGRYDIDEGPYGKVLRLIVRPKAAPADISESGR